MGTNYYLLKKTNYIGNEPSELGCCEGHDYVDVLNNGYVFNNTYYKNETALNKDYYQKIHIGKSSCGWYFGLAIYPEYGINNINDYLTLFGKKGCKIVDEYGEKVKASDMINIICHRKNDKIDENKVVELSNQDSFRKFNNYDDYLEYNHALRGKNNLLQHKEDKYVKHSEYPDLTFDYIISGNDPETGDIFC